MPTFEIDWDHDRASASNGWSRFAHYLTDYADQFEDINRDGYDDNRVPFARLAFRVATGPVMAPGLIRCTGGPIANWDISRSDWNGNLLGEVALVVPAPHVLVQARPAVGDYFREPSYMSWSDRYDDVSEQDIERGPYLITSTRVLWEIDRTALPETGVIPSDLRELHALAAAHLEVLTNELNRQIDPLIAALKG